MRYQTSIDSNTKSPDFVPNDLTNHTQIEAAKVVLATSDLASIPPCPPPKPQRNSLAPIRGAFAFTLTISHHYLPWVMPSNNNHTSAGVATLPAPAVLPPKRSLEPPSSNHCSGGQKSSNHFPATNRRHTIWFVGRQ
ncbi:hypothetical protein DdX_09915 [Ditylenchus destructor]|uniref:Uncharacterized protein n=1 Tax=Ditylenchus destructor TaxID=166010 RepID=A0AAD4MYX2_9BILA|nr:hypothetical protein DdX_09915 [Ditylenchus destructor]